MYGFAYEKTILYSNLSLLFFNLYLIAITPIFINVRFQGFATTVNEYAADENQIPYGLLTEGQWVVFTENVLGFLVTHDQQPQMTIFHRVIQNSLLLLS